MRESRLTEIPLPEITTAAMLATVEFLYTGSIVHNQPTVASAFQTVQASRFFMLDKLEKYVTDYIVAGLKAEVVDADGEFLVWCVTQFAEQIYTSDKHIMDKAYASDKHIMDKAYVDSGVAGLVQDMVRKLEAMDTHGHLLNSLCVQAFDVYLAATDGLNRWTISFKEYLRLRRILLWACSKVSRQAEEKLRIGLPDEECLRGESKFRTCRESIAKKAPVAKRPLDPSVLQERTWVEKLNLGWASVELQCIHPLILVEILEPLDVVPYPLFLSALKWQALLAGEMNVLKWRPNNTCTIVENGAVLQCAGHIPDERFVVGCANMAMNHGMCGWEITVETPCERVWIGPGDFVDGFWASLDSQRGRLHRRDSKKFIPCKKFGHQGSKVRVNLDMKLRTCVFTIDGDTLDASWTDLPYAIYPTVALTKSGRVRIELIQGEADFN